MKSILLVSLTNGELCLDIFLLCLILLVLGLLIVILSSTTEKTDAPYQIGPDPEKEPPITTQPQKAIDPLRILREDTYSNEEINEMTGRMIREEYKRENP
jgi:hypothetical protein